MQFQGVETPNGIRDVHVFVRCNTHLSVRGYAALQQFEGYLLLFGKNCAVVGRNEYQGAFHCDKFPNLLLVRQFFRLLLSDSGSSNISRMAVRSASKTYALCSKSIPSAPNYVLALHHEDYLHLHTPLGGEHCQPLHKTTKSPEIRLL
ncbi:MAG: hypothetical protein ACLSCV_00150 [Acutalibacteraceae bacterium]